MNLSDFVESKYVVYRLINSKADVSLQVSKALFELPLSVRKHLCAQILQAIESDGLNPEIPPIYKKNDFDLLRRFYVDLVFSAATYHFFGGDLDGEGDCDSALLKDFQDGNFAPYGLEWRKGFPIEDRKAICDDINGMILASNEWLTLISERITRIIAWQGDKREWLRRLYHELDPNRSD